MKDDLHAEEKLVFEYLDQIIDQALSAGINKSRYFSIFITFRKIKYNNSFSLVNIKSKKCAIDQYV
jgi:hypothetical protein